MTQQAISAAPLPVSVEDRPHWRLVIRPGIYDPHRLGSASECWRTIAGLSIGWRGWDFPHIDEDPRNQRTDNTSISSWIDWGHHLEYWRFYESGQFLWKGAFWEDRMELDAGTIVSSLRGAPPSFLPSGVLDTFGCVYHLTEFFEFASRLALRGILDETGVVEVSMCGVRDRVLMHLDRPHFPQTFRKADADTLDREWPAAGFAVAPRAHAAALDAAVWFFERFGWREPDRDALTRIQHELIDGRGRFAGLARGA
jgi:hypothetical protein